MRKMSCPVDDVNHAPEAWITETESDENITDL